MRIPFAYGMALFGASAMQSLFITYYVTLYLTVYNLSTSWFFFGETAFLIWNSLNDPLFGYLLRGWSVRERLPAIRGGGALWVLSFALFFVLPVGLHPWMVGLHFVVCLLLYDTFLSYVLIVHTSLLADVTKDKDERTSCNAWGSAFSIAGSLSVLGANMLWDAHSIGPFRVFSLVAALLSLGAMQLSFLLLNDSVNSEHAASSLPVDESARLSLGGFWRDLRRHGDFWVFAGITVVQVFNCHFNSNFMAVSLDRFFAPSSSVMSASFLLSAAAVLPHVLVVALAPVLRVVGVRLLLRALVVVKIAVGLAGWYFLTSGGASVAELGAFFLLNKSCTEVICRHGNLLVAELVDEDASNMELGAVSRSSMYFGAIALFTKPGQALAAMVGYLALQKDAPLFQMVTLVPVGCGLVQTCLFFMFASGESKPQLKIV